MATVGLKATWDATGGVVIADKATSTSILEIDAVNKRIETPTCNVTTIAATTGNITTVAATTVGATTGNITTVNATTVAATNVTVNSKAVVYAVTCYLADANTAGSGYVVAPIAGTVVKVSVVPFVNNADTKTVFTTAIAGGAITHPACEIASTGTAGTATTVVPTAANTVTAGQVLSVTSDGGGTPTMPVSVTFTIQL